MKDPLDKPFKFRTNPREMSPHRCRELGIGRFNRSLSPGNPNPPSMEEIRSRARNHLLDYTRAQPKGGFFSTDQLKASFVAGDWKCWNAVTNWGNKHGFITRHHMEPGTGGRGINFWTRGPNLKQE
jgi:hypothetical protein